MPAERHTFGNLERSASGYAAGVVLGGMRQSQSTPDPSMFDADRVARASGEALFVTFATDAAERLAALARAARVRNGEEIRCLARSLKGTSHLVGAMHLSDWCEKLEVAALVEACELVARARVEYEGICYEIRTLLARQGRGTSPVA